MKYLIVIYCKYVDKNNECYYIKSLYIRGKVDMNIVYGNLLEINNFYFKFF